MIDFTKLRNLIIENKCVSSNDYGKEDPFIGIYWEDLIALINYCDSTKWISIEEALPDYEEDVLVTNDVGDYWFSHRTENDNVMQDKNNFASVDSIFNITHWMPIPSLEGGE